MNRTFRRTKGKSKPIVINDELRQSIKQFKKDLEDYIEINNPEESRIKAIRFILNKLESYDRNILLLYFSYNCSPSKTAKALGVTPIIINNNIKRIIKNIASSCTQTYSL